MFAASDTSPVLYRSLSDPDRLGSGEPQMAQLIERLDTLLTCRSASHHRDPNLLYEAIPGFGGYRSLPRESNSRRGDTIGRITLFLLCVVSDG